MKKIVPYIIAIVSVFLVSLLGSIITDYGMPWYNSINLPGFTPEGSVIGMIWSFIFILILISVLLFLKNNKEKKELRFNFIVSLFIVNAILNVFWSALFFAWNLLLLSVIEMSVLNLTTLLLIIFLWKKNKVSSILLWPYFLWVAFATYLAYSIYLLN
jgi:translocator protein